jgi:hypothetical protein
MKHYGNGLLAWYFALDVAPDNFLLMGNRRGKQ